MMELRQANLEPSSQSINITSSSGSNAESQSELEVINEQPEEEGDRIQADIKAISFPYRPSIDIGVNQDDILEEQKQTTQLTAKTYLKIERDYT